MKRKTKTEDSPLILPKEVSLSTPPSPFGPPLLRRWTGKTKGKFPLAFSIVLPKVDCESTEKFLEEVRDAFLTFLSKEGEKERSAVWFGGMSFAFQENALVLKAAFCPFSQRQYFPCAEIFLSPDGEILKIDSSLSKQKKRNLLSKSLNKLTH